MSESITITQINPHIYLMYDRNGIEAAGYLVLGSKKALVIDTMNGVEDVKAVVRSITSLPIMVVNTHGHPDHIYGNIFFDHAYMHPADLPIAHEHMKEPGFTESLRERGLHMPEFLSILPGELIDLGDLRLEVIGIPGHTPGSIGLLLRQDRILFVGDSVVGDLWLQLEESLPLEECLKTLNGLERLLPYFDYILTGHGQGLEDAALCMKERDGIAELLAGKTENDQPYQWFLGECMAHPYGNQNRKIVYQAEDLI